MLARFYHSPPVSPIAIARMKAAESQEFLRERSVMPSLNKEAHCTHIATELGLGLELGFGARAMSKLRDERGRKRRRGRAVEGGIAMGRKPGVMRVNPKHLTRRTMPCFQEMLVFLSCLHKFNYDDDKVVKEKNALNMCMDVQAKQGKQHNTINYHLQRISRTMKGAG